MIAKSACGDLCPMRAPEDGRLRVSLRFGARLRRGLEPATRRGEDRAFRHLKIEMWGTHSRGRLAVGHPAWILTTTHDSRVLGLRLSDTRHLRPNSQQKTLSCLQNSPKMAPKNVSDPCFEVFTRNSPFTRALIREILYSHSLLKCAILINLSQKIAKFQTNASGPNGRFQANICLGIGALETNICVHSMGLRHPYPPPRARNKNAPGVPRPKHTAPNPVVPRL